MRRAHVVSVAGIALALVAGCDDGTSDYNLVSTLRLLDVKSEPAEVHAGDTVQMTALALATDGSAIDITWIACALPPYPGAAVNPMCLDKDAGQSWLFPIGTGASVSAPLPSVPAETFGDADATGGVYLPIRVTLETAKESLDGVYRLRYALDGTGDPAAPNHNPSLAGVFVGSKEIAEGEPLPAGAGDKLALTARFKTGSAETYSVARADGSRRTATEQLSVTWFATAGHFDPGSTGDGNDTTLDFTRNPPSAGATIDVWVVGRDERGGSDWLHRQIRIQ